MPTYEDRKIHYEIGFMYDAAVPAPYRTLRNYSGISYLSWYIRHGELTLETARKRLTAGPGAWILMDPLTVRSHGFSIGAQIVSIRFRINWHGLHFLPPLLVPRIYQEPEDAPLLAAAERMCEFEKIYPELDSSGLESVHCRRQALFSEWLHQWHRVREQISDSTPTAMDPRIYQIMSALGEHPSIAVIDYAHLRRKVGLSRAQINRIFKAGTGLTPRQWSDAQCLRAAEDMLRAGEHSIKEIAGALNFFDASHFTKWFRTKMGAAPSAWREF